MLKQTSFSIQFKQDPGSYKIFRRAGISYKIISYTKYQKHFNIIRKKDTRVNQDDPDIGIKNIKAAIKAMFLKVSVNTCATYGEIVLTERVNKKWKL